MTMFQRMFLLVAILSLILSSSPKAHAQNQTNNGGKWKYLKRSVGISAMHVALLPSGRYVAFDRTDFGRSNISLPDGKCRDDKNDTALRHDCTAHSILFDPVNRAVRPLMVQTDTWCSSGTLLPNGTLMQTGGFGDGERVVRYLAPCEGCDWYEEPNGLSVRRWYATNHVLQDGRTVVVGGRGQFSYEFVPKREGEQWVYDLPFLRETRDQWENNLYPFVHLSPDGNLFIFANTKSILLDYVNNKVVRTYPEIPGGIARNYPSTGSSVLLPLLLNQTWNNVKAQVMICGGTWPNAIHLANTSNFIPASNTCGRLTITDEYPEWIMEEMPIGRVMGDMVLLPTGNDVLIINGASKGSAGWTLGREPVLSPVLYKIGYEERNESASFEVMNPTKIPRVYHSTAHLMVDGRVMVGGSNPNVLYEFSNVLFPTELSLEAFSPPYIGGNRPIIARVGANDSTILRYGEKFYIEFDLKVEKLDEIKVTMVAPAFTTHSFSMSQRVLVLSVESVQKGEGLLKDRYFVDVFAPMNADVAPPGFYMVFVVHCGVPSRGQWVQLLWS